MKAAELRLEALRIVAHSPAPPLRAVQIITTNQKGELIQGAQVQGIAWDEAMNLADAVLRWAQRPLPRVEP